MDIPEEEKERLIAEIAKELGAKRDGAARNLVSRCPCCKKDGKFGVYTGKETGRKKLFMAHCFSCGYAAGTLEQLLAVIGRPDLMAFPVTDINAKVNESVLFPDSGDEIDDSLGIVEPPDFYRRVFSHPYLESRGFTPEDYDYFPVGITGRLNFRYADYVVFPVTDAGDMVGYVARHTWSKREIDACNAGAKARGGYRVMRFRNSTGNDFVKLLYNYDAVTAGETDTVILAEGIFDVAALTRKLELYDNTRVRAVATFGKKISDVQIYKLQQKGVATVVVGYDGDAVEAIKRTADRLKAYFKVFIADIPHADRDWEDLTGEEVCGIFSCRLKTPLEYSLNKVQEL